jgi:hypothetical protein
VRDRTSQGRPRCENTQACDFDIIEDMKKRGSRCGIENVWWRFVKSGIHSAARTISAVSNVSTICIIHYRGGNLHILLRIIFLPPFAVAYNLNVESLANPVTPTITLIVFMAKYDKCDNTKSK